VRWTGGPTTTPRSRAGALGRCIEPNSRRKKARSWAKLGKPAVPTAIRMRRLRLGRVAAPRADDVHDRDLQDGQPNRGLSNRLTGSVSRCGPRSGGGWQVRCPSQSLTAQLLRVALDAQIPVWTNCPLKDFVFEDDGDRSSSQRRRARDADWRPQGVLPPRAGFAHNAEMRDKYPIPAGPDRSYANPGDTGECSRRRWATGATALMTTYLDGCQVMTRPDRGPGAQRPAASSSTPMPALCNESGSYIDVAKRSWR